MAYVVIPVGASIAHEIDWAARAPAGASILTSTWVVSPSGEGIATETPGGTGMTRQVNIVATIAAKFATVSNIVAFDDGSDDVQAISVRSAAVGEVA